MITKNKKVRDYIFKYLIRQVVKGNYETLQAAYGDFYNIRDKVKLQHIVRTVIQEQINNMHSNAMLLGKYLYYPQTGKYIYFG